MTDKSLIYHLGNNCRLSYQMLARKTGLTVNGVKKRVNKLIETGIIDRFTVHLTGRGIVPRIRLLLALVSTDGKEDKQVFIQELGDTQLFHEVITLVDGRYICHAQVARPDDVLILERSFREKDCIKQAEIRQYHHVHETVPDYSPASKMPHESISFTELQIQVLRCLVENARMSISEIATHTKFTTKRVRKVITELETSKTLRFSIRNVFGAGEDFDCFIKLQFDEHKVEPIEIMDWFRKRYPLNHWWGFRYVDEPIYYDRLLVNDMHIIEEISDLVKQLPFVESVETLVFFKHKNFPLLAERLLHQMLELPIE